MCSSCILWRLNHTHLRDRKRENSKKKKNWMTIWTSNGCALYSSLKSQLFAELKGYGSMTALGFFFVILNDFFSLLQILT